MGTTALDLDSVGSSNNRQTITMITLGFLSLMSLSYSSSLNIPCPGCGPLLARAARSAEADYALFDKHFKPVYDEEGEQITADPYHYKHLPHQDNGLPVVHMTHGHPAHHIPGPLNFPPIFSGHALPPHLYVPFDRYNI